MEAIGLNPTICLKTIALLMFLIQAHCYENYGSKESSASVFDPSFIGKHVDYYYTRFPEVQKACSSLLSSTSRLEMNIDMASKITEELQFQEGDWVQESGNAPIMPFDGRDAPANRSGFFDPLPLASFSVSHVDSDVQSGLNFINVSGVLSLGLSRSGNIPESADGISYTLPGSTQLQVKFEGIYTESNANGGERILCMLGNGVLPARQLDSDDETWSWIKNGHDPPVLKDNQILLVLRYPKIFSLTTRAVLGDLISLNKMSSPSYFDKVVLSSQLSVYSKYRFGTHDDLVSKVCDPYPYRDGSVFGRSSRFGIYQGSNFCNFMGKFTYGHTMNLVPNWNCHNSTDQEFCSKLGPFMFDHGDGVFSDFKLWMRVMRCEQRAINSSEVRVAAEFKAVSKLKEDQGLVSQMTGLMNGRTLWAEGTWKPSSGQLCMAGCIGFGHKYPMCYWRVCLYIPQSFSITQRSSISGSIFSINSSHFPLSFEKPLIAYEQRRVFSILMPYKYTFSKINLEGDLFKKVSPQTMIGDSIKKSLLVYPNNMESLRRLLDDLTLRTLAVPENPAPKYHAGRPLLKLGILSLGSYMVNSIRSSMTMYDQQQNQQLLNVSAELSISGEIYSHIAMLYLEGIYNQENGMMYLVGCRDLRASWKSLPHSMGLEDGYDCLVEVQLEYPPMTGMWLMNPTAKVSITSQRRKGEDPLYFDQIKLGTLPIMYQQQHKEMHFRRHFEAVLRLFTLSAVIVCIMTQLAYVRKNSTNAPYLSLLMLGSLALGFSIPMIFGVGNSFTSMTEELYYKRLSAEFGEYDWLSFYMINFMVKILLLVAFLLTLRLGQKVLKSRIRLLSHSPSELRRVPSDHKLVLPITFAIHSIGFLLILVAYNLDSSRRAIIADNSYMNSSENSNGRQEEGMVILGECVGLVRDFFLLPQIIGNFLWRMNCMPLRKTFYFGITGITSLTHMYQNFKGPVYDPYIYHEQSELVKPVTDPKSNFGDVAIPVTAIIFAVIVFIQQQWRFRKYERTPTVSIEAELVTGMNEETSAHDT